MQFTRTTTRDLRWANRLKILHHLYAAKPVSRLALSRACDLSLATVANVIADLLREGIVVEAGLVDSEGGRPTALLQINPTRGFLIGVDVSETYIHFDLFDLTLQHCATVERGLRDDENQPDQIVSQLVRGINELMSIGGVTHSDVLGVGISLPGLVDRVAGMAVFAPNWGWRQVPVLDLLRPAVPLPLFLDNPLKACTLAELWFGAGRGIDHFLTITIGTGVGVGIAVNGALYRGATNSAGEWGHVMIERGGRLCHCGKQGCLEAYLGALGIIQTLCEHDPTSGLQVAHDQTATIRAIATAAQCGDPTALLTVRDTTEYLGAGVAMLVNLFNPQVIVLRGWVIEQLGSLLLPGLRQAVAADSLQQSLGATTIQLTTLHHNEVSLGAATFALEGFLATLRKGATTGSTANPLGRSVSAD